MCLVAFVRSSMLTDFFTKNGREMCGTIRRQEIAGLPKNPELSKQMLAKQQQDGVDAHSLAVDPLFVDPANGDFRLRPDSPALQLGFVPFDMSKVGLIDNMASDEAQIEHR